MHCIVEIFGHAQIAGKVSEQTIAGQGFIRVDVPKTSKRDGFTRFYGPGAIYAMTPVDEKIAALMAEKLEIEPVSEWTLQRAMQKLLPVPVSGQATTGPHPDLEDWDSSSEWPDDDDDTPFFGDMPDGDEPEDDPLEPVKRLVSDEESVPDLHAAPTPENVERALSQLEQDKRAAAQWARELLKGEFVIFDTETTGFEADDEIVQIGIIDQTGAVVLERLIKPTRSIPNSDYHGITDEMVANAPGFPEVYGQIALALNGKRRVAYNLVYDSRMVNQVCDRHKLPIFLWHDDSCAMEKYAQFNGEWNDYHGNYRWKKLSEALSAFGLKHEDFGTKEHDACTDARATLALIKKMAEFGVEAQETAPAAMESPS
jgi:DNA polymerase III epsilon subunit-like protein